LLFSLVANFTWAQSETATVSGQVVDPSGLNVKEAQVKLVDIDRDTSTSATTNNSGLYTFPSVRPGRYRMEVRTAGFKVVNVTGMTVNVQDHLEQNFTLVVGSTSESITVEGSPLSVDTESASVSTVVDRNLTDNLPLNGRSFQTLIELTPGVVVTPSTFSDGGQFSVNGQRASSNYWTVDGVSANIGAGPGVQGQGTSGSLPAFGAQGGTNSLVSVDAVEEFRVQTSTFAPEFGRTPGGQISIVTRSGTNQVHGTLFNYLRNDVFDANDWFADNLGLPKPREKQNDFGGTIGGPIFKDKTFFFFSYEGLRLALPEVQQTIVPSIAARQGAISAVAPFLNAYPLPNGPDLGNGTASFDASYSNQSRLDAASLRLDHRFGDRLNGFARYDYAPSSIDERPASFALSDVRSTRLTTQTATAGLTLTFSHAAIDDFRINFSRSGAESSLALDNLGGAVPLTLSDWGASTPNPLLSLFILPLQSELSQGANGSGLQRQFNITNAVSFEENSHLVKLGIDYRRLTPVVAIPPYSQTIEALNVAQAQDGEFSLAFVDSALQTPLVLQEFSAFAQDAWHAAPHLVLTYGIRWDIDASPTTSTGPALSAVANFWNLSQLTLAPAGTPLFKTRYTNVAPRIGISYQVSGNEHRATVLRAGFGIFYDSPNVEVGNQLAGNYPFGASNIFFGGAFPLSPTDAAPPPISPSQLASGTLTGVDPRLRTPRVFQWSAAIEKKLGDSQSISITGVGAVGRDLLASEFDLQPNSNIAEAYLVSNEGTSDYQALQLQYERHLSRGLQGIASYSWSHSIDDGSSSSIGNNGDIYNRQLGANANRGPSDFDIRHSLSAAVTYEVPKITVQRIVDSLMRGWSVQNIFQARTASPVDLADIQAFFLDTLIIPRPDVVPGIPLYLYGSQFPGHKAFNPSAFTSPPTDPSTGAVLRQGDLSRNALRGFGEWQWDFAFHRDFSITERLRLQFRAEFFNFLNHPNFGNPDPDFGGPHFGVATQTLANSLSHGNLAAGGFSPLYQTGGPRSIQLALKLSF
jgi:hypothetical protein